MMIRTLALFASFLGCAAGFAGDAEANGRDMSPGHRCLAAAIQWEKRLDTPDGLVRAIALAETGRWDALDGRSIPWPWTVNNGGAGTHYATKQAAIAAVKALQRDGETNIDVGCMQVNLGWHGKHFRSLEDAFDPDANMVVAAGLLNRQYRAHHDWQVAAGNYHSATPHLHQRYRKKVDGLLASLDRRLPMTSSPNLRASLKDLDPRVAARTRGRASRPHWASQGGAGVGRAVQQAQPSSPQATGAKRAEPRGMTMADYRSMARPKAKRSRPVMKVVR